MIWESWKRGESARHHLWGVTHLPKHGIAVDILPYEKFAILKKDRLGRRLRSLGDIDQQLRVLLRWPQYDIVYSACQNITYLLAFLRSHGVFRKPLVATMHGVLAKTSKNQMFIDGHDRLLCLSQVVKEQLEERFHVSEGKLELLHWGVDLSFYETVRCSRNKHEYILAAGKTMRDYDTLAKAFLEINYPLLICCDKHSAPTIPDLPSYVRVRSSLVTNRELLSDYRKAYAVAIPLNTPQGRPPSIIGLTSLLEAMAMGKAVVMTRTRPVDIDIEKERIGIWIEPGDVEGWRRAISYLLAHPHEAMEMGKRGYLLCKKEYNLEAFSTKLAAILRDVLSQNS